MDKSEEDFHNFKKGSKEPKQNRTPSRPYPHTDLKYQATDKEATSNKPVFDFISESFYTKP